MPHFRCNRFKALVLLVMLVGSSACVSALAEGFSRDPEWMERVTDEDIRRTLEAPPDLTLPLRIAISVDEGGYYGVPAVWKDTLLERTRIAIEAWDDALVEQVAEIRTALPELELIEGAPFEYLKRHRFAAAQRQAEIALVLMPSYRDETLVNGLGVFYLTLVGAFLVPGTDHHAYARVDAVAVDVRDGSLLAATSGEAEVTRMGPTWGLDMNRGRDEARTQALDAMLGHLERDFGDLVLQELVEAVGLQVPVMPLVVEGDAS